MESCWELARLRATNRMMDAVVDEIDGRLIRIGDRWLADFASCNYLGFDLDQEIIDAVPHYLAQWGTHPSWSRLLGSPSLYELIEEQLSELLGAEDALALPTITHIHLSVLPVLAAAGNVFLDSRAHKTIYDGCTLAQAHGATVHRYRHDDLEHLEQLLRTVRGAPRVICTDGLNSMTGNVPDLPELARLARTYDALLYVDDAHGFGVIGERGVDEPSSYGSRGNSIVRYFDESYDGVLLVGGFSKAYSSLLAFIACSSKLKGVLKVAAPPYLYSGPSPVASLATALTGLRVNRERGDAIRTRLQRKTQRVLDRLEELGIRTPNDSGFPIVEVPLAHPDQIDDVANFLFDHGIYVTLAAYPLVPRHEVGFRIQVTDANSDEELSLLVDVLGELAQRFEFQARAAPAEACRRRSRALVGTVGKPRSDEARGC